MDEALRDFYRGVAQEIEAITEKHRLDVNLVALAFFEAERLIIEDMRSH